MAYDLQLFSNNAVTLLAAPILISSTSLTVMPGYGALFPQPIGANQFFLITLENQTATAREIVRVNGRTGDTFTNLVRGQEGTTAAAWFSTTGNDTLVDHRVTAETMRLAMLLPESTGSSTLQIQKDAIAVGTSADTLNFEGAVTVVGAGNVKTITITAGTSTIQGETSSTPVNIAGGTSEATSTVTYSQYQRGFKFFVTLFSPSTFRSSTFEVLGNVGGNFSTNSESATWNRTARVGYNFIGSVNIVLDTTSKILELTWLNGESSPVQVMCTRIQHLP